MGSEMMVPSALTPTMLASADATAGASATSSFGHAASHSASRSNVSSSLVPFTTYLQLLAASGTPVSNTSECLPVVSGSNSTPTSFFCQSVFAVLNVSLHPDFENSTNNSSFTIALM